MHAAIIFYLSENTVIIIMITSWYFFNLLCLEFLGYVWIQYWNLMDSVWFHHKVLPGSGKHIDVSNRTSEMTQIHYSISQWTIKECMGHDNITRIFFPLQFSCFPNLWLLTNSKNFSYLYSSFMDTSSSHTHKYTHRHIYTYTHRCTHMGPLEWCSATGDDPHSPQSL